MKVWYDKENICLSNFISEKFLFFSSGEVYGVPLDVNKKIREGSYGYLDPVNLRSCYSESKRIGETMCVAYAKQFNLNINIYSKIIL